MKFLKKIAIFISVSSHIFPLFLLFLAFKPIAQWYLSKIPVLGVDFFNSVAYTSYLAKNLPLPFNAFKDFWFGGYPLFRDFVSLHFYAMIPFYNKLGPIVGIQTYVAVALFLFGCFSYFLFFQLSKSRALAAILAFMVLYSVNIYGSATWGGSLPFFSTQLFLPLLLAFLDKYVLSGNSRWFWAAVLAGGIGFISHPLPMFAIGLPTASILLFFGSKRTSGRIFPELLNRLKLVFIFGLGSLLVGLPVSYERLYFTINSLIRGGFSVLFAFITPPGQGAGGSSAGPGVASDISNFYRGLTKLLYTDTNIWLFYLTAGGVILFLMTLILRRRKGLAFRVFPYFLIVGYAILHTFANAYGFSFFPQGWYREFWAFPMLLGALAAVSWGTFFDFVRDKLNFKNIILGQILVSLPFVILSLIFFTIGYLFFASKSQSFFEILDLKSEISSAHPQALSIKTSKEELAETKKRLLPDFIDPNDKNKRLYEADALVNIWWNAFFDVPLARGYTDPPLAVSQRGGLFWLDIAIANDTLVRDFKISENVAFANALFLIDWNGIYYYEGGRFGISASVPPSSYLVNNNIFEKESETTAYGALIKWQTPSGKPELNLEIPQYLKFYKVKDEFTSPVIYPSNASTILVISDFAGYEDILRGFGAFNLNSRYVVPVAGGKYIDEFNLGDFSKFDGIILHNYSYRNKGKAFNLLRKYLEGGGKIFIDTGAETQDSNASDLPEIFPMDESVREGQGKNWDLETAQDKLLEGVKPENFGPLIFNEQEWKLTYPKGELREGSMVLLKHKDKPVLIRRQVGNGQLIWSGLNLVYHFNQYKSEDEMKLFFNILTELAPIQKTEPVDAVASWQSPQKVTLAANSGARGVIFKEQHYKRWKARLLSEGNETLKVYSAGPTFPGYMWAFLPENKPFKIEFNYRGQFSAYLIYIFTVVLILILVDRVLFNGFFIGKRIRFAKKAADSRLSNWWEKEELE